MHISWNLKNFKALMGQICLIRISWQIFLPLNELKTLLVVPYFRYKSKDNDLISIYTAEYSRIPRKILFGSAEQKKIFPSLRAINHSMAEFSAECKENIASTDSNTHTLVRIWIFSTFTRFRRILIVLLALFLYLDCFKRSGCWLVGT